MYSLQNNALLLPVAALLWVISLPTHATVSWTFSNENQATSGGCGTYSPGNTCTRTATEGVNTVKVDATAWASSSATSTTTSNLQAATLKLWDGLGVTSSGQTNESTSPNHATDNSGKLESILFKFDQAITLESISMGWHQDADFSLLRYTGSAAPSLTTSTYSTLTTTGGWELVGNYIYSGSSSSSGGDLTAKVAQSTTDYVGPKDKTGALINYTSTSNLSSSYWLIVAINSAFSNSTDTSLDYFKVKTLTASVTPPQTGTTPEPSTIALFAIAFAGWQLSQRKTQSLLA